METISIVSPCLNSQEMFRPRISVTRWTDFPVSRVDRSVEISPCVTEIYSTWHFSTKSSRIPKIVIRANARQAQKSWC